MHGMFDPIINMIETPCLGMSNVFIKMGFLYQILQWSHIDLHFDFKSLLKCIEKLWIQVKTFMHGMFDPIINIIRTPCLGMSIVFIKMASLYQILQWSHINLHFDFKSFLECNFNVYI